jgi:mannose-1-phosphate guanylyltransferase
VADRENKLVTVGITPTFPSTGYGYICYDKSLGGDVMPVKEFVEKPDYDTAVSYLNAGCYAWNSGMFVWKASVILEKFRELLPDIYACIEKIGAVMGTDQESAVIEEIYPTIPKISVDYGIMERADNVVVIPAEMGWDDVGSWETLGVLYDKDERGNILRGEQVNIDTTNCISYAKNGLIATVGVDNLIIVQTEDAVLVCAKDRAQDVKLVVDQLKAEGKTRYL